MRSSRGSRSCPICFWDEAIMTASDIDSVIDAFWQELRRGVHFPKAWNGKLSLDEAYRVQLGLVARRVAAGERQVGWKVGLTSKAIQEQFRVPHPVLGCLFESGIKSSGDVFTHADIVNPGFENEICMRLARDLAGPKIGIEDARRAVEVCYPAFEITETHGDFTGELSLAIADNAQQKAFVLGAPSPLTPDLDLSALGVRVEINGQEVATGRGDAVLGHPLNSLVWLAGKLAELDRGLKAGDYVMTGSFTRQFPIAKGDHIRSVFDRLGAVEARFV
jgi:2-keto-4-pentenoate hydratase